MIPWQGERPIEIDSPTGMGWVRLSFKILAVLIMISILFPPLLVAQRLNLDKIRWATVRIACRLALRVLGLSVKTRGMPLRMSGGMVANHCCWLDVIVLNSVHDAYFVSKAEVRKWPVCGAIAQATGTVFIRRRIMDALVQKIEIAARIGLDHRLLFFPEGTSTDGLRVLRFRPTLFAAYFDDEFRNAMRIQPVSFVYAAPSGRRRDFYGWWGDASFVRHAAMIISAPSQGEVEVVFHEPLEVRDFSDRKQLARTCEEHVRSAVQKC